MISNAIKNYLKDKPFHAVDLKAVLFDMDGVLYDSMSNHAAAWVKTMSGLGVPFSAEEAYLHEGRTGEGTINIAFQRAFGRSVTKEEAAKIYGIKSACFNDCPQAEVMPGIVELLKKVKAAGLQPMLVTGSGQKSLLDRLNMHFPDTFKRELMITADDVIHGKPHPEPYLKALQKGRFKPEEAIVVENAPLGVESAHRAGIFTVAVNTGPLNDRVLFDAGADLLFADMPSFCDNWEALWSALKTTRKE
ncbi:MAG: HAD-IA family hydrolase [Candidatus Azobacteroides sp.]|nr:HAD-IA family hydrolase [Candidatus Azobacteroides sp.]